MLQFKLNVFVHSNNFWYGKQDFDKDFILKYFDNCLINSQLRFKKCNLAMDFLTT